MRRNPPRGASYNPIRDMPDLSLPVYSEEFATRHRFRLGTDAPPSAGWADVATMAALIKIVIGPHMKNWSKSHRFFAGAALLDCIYDLLDVDREILSEVYKKCPFYDELATVLKDRASVNPTFSHSTGDNDDRMTLLLLPCCSGPLPTAPEGADESAPEEVYSGWEASQRKGAREGGNEAEGGGDQAPNNASTGDRPSASSSSAPSAPPTAGSNAAPPAAGSSAPAAGPSLSKLKPSAPALEKAKKDAAQTKGIEHRS
ncbi:hypothetical protein A4X13_0g6802 [Tilletia indica]|uniref:Uncharacterized protein n=1 Tax=Tilletia indica TaxID=43049 RepID=A0A8T8SNI1_9BASI|nr:hypothetical protein A4X13_0g6802 [Tilletia indica]